MKRCFVYFFLSLRSYLKLIPAFILTALLVLLATVAVLRSVIKEDTLAKVGICGEVEGIYLNIATSFFMFQLAAKEPPPAAKRKHA